MGAAHSAAVISAALPRVISRLRRGYVRASHGLYFLPFGQKVNECAPCAHIFIAECIYANSAGMVKSVRWRGSALGSL